MAKNEVKNDGVMGWEDDLENDGVVNSILPEGDYNFQITKLERGRFPGSAKIPACNKATITMQVVASPTETAYCTTDLILHKSLEWKLSSFFRCIGQKKHGERIKMDWDKVEGSFGRAHFKPREYTNNEGKTRQANNVDYYIDYDEKNFTLDMWKDADISESGF